jgi:hypothetical protein
MVVGVPLDRVGSADTGLAHLDHMRERDWFTYSSLCALDSDYPLDREGAEGKPTCGVCKDVANEEGLEIPA